MGRKAKDDIRKPQILEHLRDVINQEGLQKASMARVAQHMGVSTNLVLHYFKTKDALLMALIDYLGDEIFLFLGSVAENGQEPVQRVKAMLKAMFGKELQKQLLVENSYYALHYISHHNEQMRKKIDTIHNNYKDFWENEINSIKLNGKTPPRDSNKLAETIIALFEGFGLIANMQLDRNCFEEQGHFFYKKACEILNI
jgi:AcrR family transcriptional regulator